MREETHSVGSVTGVIMPKFTISCSAVSIGSLYSMGTLQRACCTGGIEGSVQIVYVPHRLPTQSNDRGNANLRVIMLQT